MLKKINSSLIKVNDPKSDGYLYDRWFGPKYFSAKVSVFDSKLQAPMFTDEYGEFLNAPWPVKVIGITPTSRIGFSSNTVGWTVHRVDNPWLYFLWKVKKSLYDFNTKRAEKKELLRLRKKLTKEGFLAAQPYPYRPQLVKAEASPSKKEKVSKSIKRIED